MSEKKKKTHHPTREKMVTLWRAGSLYVCGVLLVAFLAAAFTIWYKLEHAPAAALEHVQQAVKTMNSGSFKVEIVSLSETSALLNITGDCGELNGVLLHYTPETVADGRIDRIVISSGRIHGDLAGGCRELLALLNGSPLKCTGTVTIGTFTCDDVCYKNVVLTQDPLRAWVFIKGKTDDAELEIDQGGKILRMKGDFPCCPSLLLPDSVWNGDAGLIFSNLWSWMQKYEEGEVVPRCKIDDMTFRAQELVLSLAEDTHLSKRVIQLRADDFVQYNAATGDFLCTWQGNTFKAKLDAATGTADFEINAPENQNRSYKGKFHPDGTVTGKGSVTGEVPYLTGRAAKKITEFGDGFEVIQVTATDYREEKPAFSWQAPLCVSKSGGIEFKGGTLTLTGTGITAKDVAVKLAQDPAVKGTFSLGSVWKDGRTIGSVSGTVNGENLTGKAVLYGLEGSLTGKLVRDGEKLEYTITFPRQQIKKAGKDLLPPGSPARLQGFAALKMDQTGAFDLVVDNGELDLAPVKLSNFKVDLRTQIFSFDHIAFCGLTFGKGQGKYRLESGRPVLEGMTFDWCGGTCSLLPQMEKGNYTLECSGLLLADFFRELKIGDFSGAGRITGRIPLTVGGNGALTLGKISLYSVPGGSEMLKGALNEKYKSGDPAYTFVADVMRNMKYDWVKLDLEPASDNAKYDLRLSFRGKPDEPLNYELVAGSGGGTMIRKSEKAKAYNYLNLSLNLSLDLAPAAIRDALRSLY